MLRMAKTPKARLQNFRTKNPTVVNIIRNTQNKNSNWWLGKPGEDRYYSSFIENKHYIYSFTNPESARKCLQFLKEYNAKYGFYPDLYGDTSGCKPPNGEIYIDAEILDSLSYRCMVNSASLFGISEFDYTFVDSFMGQKNVFNLSISGIDLLEQNDNQFDKDLQIEHFNYLMDF